MPLIALPVPEEAPPPLQPQHGRAVPPRRGGVGRRSGVERGSGAL